MKKLMKTLLCLGTVLVLSCALSCFVSAETLTDGDYSYTVLDDSTAEITKYNGTETDVVIPDTLGGYTVTSVGKEAFKNNTTILSVDFADTVTNIGNYAFSCCSNLSQIKLNEGLQTLGAFSFEKCDSVEFVNIPSTVISGGYAMGAFYECKKLSTVSFAEGTTTIPQCICRNAVSLTTIIFPTTVKSIGMYAFDSCSALEKIVLPDTITSIDSFAFSNCSKLKDVKLNEGLLTLDMKSFGKCNSLESILIPSTVTMGGDLIGAFDSCQSLKHVAFGEGMIKIPDYICCGADALTSISFPSTVESIGYYSFASCKNLETVTLPNTITDIGDSAFYNCSTLKYVNLNEGLQKIGNNAFSYCNELLSVTIPSTVISGGSSFNGGAFSNCEQLESITFSEGMTKIPTYICHFATALTTINFPSTLTIIDNSAFSYCNSLTTVVFPENLTTINSNAFDNCQSLSKIILPDSVSSIKYRVFSGCFALDTVLILSDNITIERSSFPANENLTIFKKADATISTTATLNTINFSFADGILSFSGEYKSDLYYLFDLVAMMCTYYDDVQYLFFDSFEAVSADEGHIYYYTDNWERIEFDGTKITNVKFSVEAFDGEEFRKYSFNELCEAVGNNELENFNLVIEEADGLDRGNVEISLVDQINQMFQRILKALTNLINKLFSFFKKFGG